MSQRNRVKEIEEQLAHLQWRKRQNERNVKNSLQLNSAMVQKDAMLRVAMNRGEKRVEWLSSVVQDELSRPLVVDDAEMHRIQLEENTTKEKAYQRHIHHLESSKRIQNILSRRIEYFSESRAGTASSEGRNSLPQELSLSTIHGNNSLETAQSQAVTSSKTKLKHIKQIQRKIESEISQIQDLKPIIVAKWQPALPT